MQPRERRAERAILVSILMAIVLSSWPASPGDSSTGGRMDLGVSGTSPPSSVPWLVTGTFPVVGDTFLDEQNMSRNYGGTTQLVVGASGPAHPAPPEFCLPPIP